MIRGPSGTPFEFGVFATRLHFPSDYPLSPPKMKFVSEIFHPNGKQTILIDENN
jgi:ubiquitin-conjugating enzyme E2 G2